LASRCKRALSLWGEGAVRSDTVGTKPRCVALLRPSPAPRRSRQWRCDQLPTQRGHTLLWPFPVRPHRVSAQNILTLPVATVPQSLRDASAAAISAGGAEASGLFARQGMTRLQLNGGQRPWRSRVCLGCPARLDCRQECAGIRSCAPRSALTHLPSPLTTNERPLFSLWPIVRRSIRQQPATRAPLSENNT
jgi:hypothetical protein